MNVLVPASIAEGKGCLMRSEPIAADTLVAGSIALLGRFLLDQLAINLGATPSDEGQQQRRDQNAQAVSAQRP